MFAPLLATVVLHVLPRPAHVTLGACAVPLHGTISAAVDPGALDELRVRWGRVLGVHPAVVPAVRAQVRFARNSALGAQAYRLNVNAAGVTIQSSTSAGAFYGVMTLAQLPYRNGARWMLPCVRIDDAPALRWRILSDDVSRGPLPTMQLFRRAHLDDCCI